MKYSQIKMPFALDRNNQVVHISEVGSGLKCNCICPDFPCQSPLIAVKGSTNQHHFRHTTSTECQSGLESAIHLAGKQVIKEKKELTLPRYKLIVSKKDSKGREHSDCGFFPLKYFTKISFDSVEEEITLHDMRVDLLATKDDRQLIIEIFYRHKVDEKKIEKIRNANLPAIEIDLSELTPDDVRDPEAFWAYINDPQHIQWLHNPKAYESSLYFMLVNQLEATIKKHEKEYKQMDKELKIELIGALKTLKILRGPEHITRLKKRAKREAAWKILMNRLQLSLDELPSFLNIEVCDGDWILCCDRRIWQTAIYSAFIKNDRNQIFPVWQVASYLDGGMFRRPHCLKILEDCSKFYPTLAPANIVSDLPSLLKTLEAYFIHLQKIGMVEISNDTQGKMLIKVISKNPTDSLYALCSL